MKVIDKTSIRKLHPRDLLPGTIFKCSDETYYYRINNGYDYVINLTFNCETEFEQFNEKTRIITKIYENAELILT